MAGEIVTREARENGINVLPVDSEHNAIFQCLEGKDSLDVRRIILTASGGPFAKRREKISIRSPPNRRSSIRPGIWGQRSQSIPRRCSTRVWK